jgi:hypothetical protein
LTIEFNAAKATCVPRSTCAIVVIDPSSYGNSDDVSVDDSADVLT